MAYIERKVINGKNYYYLTESKRFGKNKWKKSRKYLGTKPNLGGARKPPVKSLLSRQQARIVDAIKSRAIRAKTR